jgi:hypothetical protein
MKFASLRIRILNWLAAPSRTQFTNNYKKETEMSTNTLTLGASAGYPVMTNVGAGYGNWNATDLLPDDKKINVQGGVNFTVRKANGGWIVQINRFGVELDYYVIAEDADFDRELGKIITMSCLKG